jgi:hypothetical protein
MFSTNTIKVAHVYYRTNIPCQSAGSQVDLLKEGRTITHRVGTGDEDGASGALDVIEGPCLFEAEALVGPVLFEQGVGE